MALGQLVVHSGGSWCGVSVPERVWRDQVAERRHGDLRARRGRASRRGVRTSLGPRAARVHVGRRRTTVSSGFGPVTVWAGGGSHHRSRASRSQRGSQRAEPTIKKHPFLWLPSGIAHRRVRPAILLVDRGSSRDHRSRLLVHEGMEAPHPEIAGRADLLPLEAAPRLEDFATPAQRCCAERIAALREDLFGMSVEENESSQVRDSGCPDKYRGIQRPA
jgi:hypothetical protein